MKEKHKEPEKNGKYLSETRQLAAMNAALAESESSYRSIFEHATDGQLVYSNPALVKMLNYNSAEELLDTINDIIEISKIETGELKVHFSLVNMAELMAYFHGFFRQQTDKSQRSGKNYW